MKALMAKAVPGSIGRGKVGEETEAVGLASVFLAVCIGVPLAGNG